jgi:hypothetical protein
VSSEADPIAPAFDSANNSLSVAAPDEGFGVRADPSIAEMLAAAAR